MVCIPLKLWLIFSYLEKSTDQGKSYVIRHEDEDEYDVSEKQALVWYFLSLFIFLYIFYFNSANLVSLYKVCHHKHRNAPLLPIRVVWYFWNLELSTQCISTREDHILIFQNLLYLILINLIIVMELQYDIIKNSIMDSTNNQDFRKRKE